METILHNLVAYRTISGDHAVMQALLAYVEDYLHSRGMHIAYVESNGFTSLIASTRPGAKRTKVMLAAHADVVTGDDMMFGLREQDGNFFGRGVLDMKFAIAAYMQAVDNIKDSLDDYDFCIVITPDEEIGGIHGLKAVIDQGYRPAIVILPDGGENWQVQTSSKGYWAFDITATGTIAHGSRPWLGDNALTKLLIALDEIAVYFPRTPGSDTNTISLTRLSGGDAMNQIPGQGSMTIDIRTVNQTEHERIHKAVIDICKKHKLAMEMVSYSPPTSTDLDHPLIRPFVDLIEERTGIHVAGSYAMGATDARFLVPHSIPFVSVYPIGGDLHGPREWLSKRAFLDYGVIVQRYLSKVASTHS